MLKTIAKRFSEPSSYAGLTAIFVAVGINVDPGIVQSAILVASGLCGLLAVFLPEGS